MKKDARRPIAVCTWSLANHLEAVMESLQRSGLRYLHLSVEAINGPEGPAFRRAIAQNGWAVSCTMTGFAQEDYSTLESIRQTGGILPDAHWPANRDKVMTAIRLTADLGVPYLSFHAGLIDHANREAYTAFSSRMRELADAAGACDVSLLLETGQETATDLKNCLEELAHPAIGVNFDPANMILYDKGDPVEAVRILAPWIRHVHIKDAIRTMTPGTWGREVAWGDGEVGCNRFLEALDDIEYPGVLAIEREAGNERVNDIVQAAERLAGA